MSSRMSRWQRLEQILAKRAWECVEEAGKGSAEVFDKYASLARGFGTLVHENGLGQSLTFVFMKSQNKGAEGRAHELFGRHLAEWLLQIGPDNASSRYRPPYRIEPSEADKPLRLLIDCIMRGTVREYRQATHDCYALLGHLRRVAQGVREAQKAEQGRAQGAGKPAESPAGFGAGSTEPMEQEEQ